MTEERTDGTAIVPFNPNASIFSRGLSLARDLLIASGRIRVIIIDDIDETTNNLGRLLGFESDIEVVGVASDGEAGVELTRAQRPDIVLMDICMPVMDGITATEIICGDRTWNGSVIMMSVQGEQDYLRRSMLAGAKEYLVKPFSVDEFVNSIRHTHHLRISGPGPCNCSMHATEGGTSPTHAGEVLDEATAGTATDAWDLLLEAGDQVFDSDSGKHGIVLTSFNPSDYQDKP